jgi:periplasmic divalent cation tolerance protein
MSAGDEVLVVYCTCPNEESGQKIADRLVGDRLAACVNLIPGLRSTYRWKGEVQRDAECLLVVKTRQSRFAAMQDAIRDCHPYELPEVIAVPVVAGSKQYLDWVLENT